MIVGTEKYLSKLMYSSYLRWWVVGTMLRKNENNNVQLSHQKQSNQFDKNKSYMSESAAGVRKSSFLQHLSDDKCK